MQLGTKRLALGVVLLILGLILFVRLIGIPIFGLGLVLILWALRDREQDHKRRQLAPSLATPAPGASSPGPTVAPPPPAPSPHLVTGPAAPAKPATYPGSATPAPPPIVTAPPPPPSTPPAPAPSIPVPPPPPGRSIPSNLPTWPTSHLTTLEMVDPLPVYAMARASPVPGKQLLIVSPDSPTILSNTHGLGERELWRLTRSEGEQQVSPADPDRLGDVISRHLEHHPGGGVVLVGLEKIVDAAGLRVAIRLVDVMRESAENHQGTVLVSLNTDVLKPAEIRQLEQSSTVLRISP